MLTNDTYTAETITGNNQHDYNSNFTSLKIITAECVKWENIIHGQPIICEDIFMDCQHMIILTAEVMT